MKENYTGDKDDERCVCGHSRLWHFFSHLKCLYKGCKCKQFYSAN